MKRIRITPNIEYIEPQGKRKLYACSGLALNGRVKVVIDTNPGRNETRDFLKHFNPDIAIISHYHSDHASWGAQVLEHTHADLFIPQEEEGYFTSLDHVLTRSVGGSEMTGMMADFARRLLSYKEIEAYITYDSPCSFIFGDISLECIRSAGHSPGHTSFYLPEHKILFTSDMGIDRLGPWYGWQDCSIEAIVDSILSLRSLEVNLLLTSHGGIITRDIKERWNRALVHILDREKRIVSLLEKGWSREQIISRGVCYPGKDGMGEPMKSFLTLWDSVMYDHHARILDTTSLTHLFPDLKTIEYIQKENRGASPLASSLLQ
jgi:glyoxylase-like metal-dependent hydrolase (beta-lactamase superfamily II)